jgi:hypothetical protein
MARFIFCVMSEMCFFFLSLSFSNALYFALCVECDVMMYRLNLWIWWTGVSFFVVVLNVRLGSFVW